MTAVFLWLESDPRLNLCAGLGDYGIGCSEDRLPFGPPGSNRTKTPLDVGCVLLMSATTCQ